MYTNLRFVDIHSHILPGIDDGTKNLEDAMLLIKEAEDIGVKEIIFTPHVSSDTGKELLDTISLNFEIFRGHIFNKRTSIRLHIGAEVLLYPELPLRIKEDKRLTVNGMGKYVLVEMPCFEIPIYAEKVFFDLLSQGVTPIWAHPERCHDVIDDYNVVDRFLKNDVLLQINAGSLIGRYDRKVKKTALALLKKGVGNFIASDVHRIGDIKAVLPEAFSVAAKLVGAARAEKMFFIAPSNILVAEPI